MLLLVVQAELDQLGQLGIVRAGLEKAQQSLVDTRTIIMNLRDRRAAQRAALVARVHRPDRLVVRVEEPVVALVDGLIAGFPGAQDEPLEEPRRVTQMPLRGAR